MEIKYRKSPNVMGRNGYTPIAIVNHITEGAYNGAVGWLCNPKSGVSSTYVVSRQGEITQLVDLDKAAWCNGTQTSNPSGARYVGRATNRLVKKYWTNANYFTVSIEHEGIYSQTGGSLTEKQYEATLWLHKHIIKEVKRLYNFTIPINRDHIMGHYEVDPKGKPNCPGKNFPFDRLIRDLTLWNYGDMEYKTKTPIANQKPTVSIEQMKEWARLKKANKLFIDLAPIFYSVAVGRKIDPALLYAQAAKETGYMNFGGVLDASFNNPCGMKTTQGGGNYDKNAHKRFKNWEQGIKAQADHLNLYAGADGYPMKDSPDPRHFPRIKGTAKTVEELGGKWAGARNYGTSIVDRMEEIKAIKTKEVEKPREDKKPSYKYAIAYANDGDLSNAQALLNVMPTNSILIKTTDAEGLNVEKVIQVGGAEVKGADIVLAGENRKFTLDKINEWVKNNL